MTHLCIALVSLYIYVFYEYSHVSRISLDRFASELSASGATFISVLRKKKHENANKLFHDEIVVSGETMSKIVSTIFAGLLSIITSLVVK